MQFLAKVKNTFTVTGRGLVLVPEQLETGFRIRVGTPIELRTPDGRSLNAHIAGVEFLKSLTGPCDMAILITREVVEEEVPVSTQIWYLNENATPESGDTPAGPTS